MRVREDLQSARCACATHLENCTGKTFRNESEEVLESISIVLGMEERARQDQAKKSAGWMPRH